MSLVIVTRFSEGFLLASDSFAYNNDSDLTIKHVEFDKYHVDDTLKTAYTSVGSRWVFLQFAAWLKGNSLSVSSDASPIPQQWKHFNDFWVTERSKEIETEEDSVLREISNSLLISCSQDHLDNITIIDHEGNLTQTPSFVIAGTGSVFVRHFLKENPINFKPDLSRSKTIDLLLECYRVAAYDLYTSGFPAICMVTQDSITDFSDHCQAAYQDGITAIYQKLQAHIERK